MKTVAASWQPGASILMPWASWCRGSRGIRLFPGTLADLHAVVVEFAVIELASVVEFVVIELAIDTAAGAGACSIAASVVASADGWRL